MNLMNDGTVIPSNFNASSAPAPRDFLFNQYALRPGAIVNISYPDQDTNISKAVIEYDVAVFLADVKSGVNISILRNCKVNNMFGSANNNLTYTLTPNAKESGIYKHGSIVLLLCQNGISDSGSAVIMGGLASNDGPAYTSADGQFYDFNFNGINYNINKDGEWTLTFNSPLDVDGNPTNKDAQGTAVKIDKDGVIKISDNEGQFFSLDRVNKVATWSNGAESITIDKANKLVSINSSGDLDIKSTKATDMSSDDAMSLSSKSDMSLSSDSNISLDAKGNLSQTSNGTWQVQASGDIMMQSGSTAIINGGSIAQIKGALTLIGEGSVPVAAVGVSMCLGIGNHGSPVVSNILTGSSTVFVGT